MSSFEATLSGGYCHQSCFTDEETEAQRAKAFVQGPTVHNGGVMVSSWGSQP